MHQKKRAYEQKIFEDYGGRGLLPPTIADQGITCPHCGGKVKVFGKWKVKGVQATDLVLLPVE